ncbi:MAG TPA: DUF4397 domain-containing protein [Actinophytocola sp.]|jgi:hypothetical protein|uniref:DUF4397 domain-containing protein n=1 Tax=Actinophytocola sp. TaxID=1872138 RepID=UPI002F946FB5
MRKFQPKTWGAVALAGALTAALIGVPPASAAAGESYLRLAHLSPDTPRVDVYLTAFGRPDFHLRVNGVGYGDVSDYQTIQPGEYTIAMRPAGAPPSTKPAISTTLSARNGRAYTVAGLGSFADLALKVLDDEISLPPAGQARMRVVNAAPHAGDLSIKRAGTAVIEHVAFGDASSYVYVPGGPTSLTVQPVQAEPTSLPVTLATGSVYTVLVLEKNGALSAGVRQDASGAKVVPHGAVETGLGGPSGSDTGLRLVLLVAAAAAGGALVLTRRRNRITSRAA